MSLPIISAQQRMAERKGVKLLMLGKSGIGKTTRLKDLDPATTLFLDIEAGEQWAEAMPFSRNGHSGYQILWNPAVAEQLKEVA